MIARPAGQDRRPLRLERVQRQARDVARGEHALLEPREAEACDPSAEKPFCSRISASAAAVPDDA